MKNTARLVRCGLSLLALSLSLGQPLSAEETRPLAKSNPSPATTAESPGATDPDAAWVALSKITPSFSPQPPEWAATKPTSQQTSAWRNADLARFRQGAALAQEFATRFPKHAKAGAARERETEFLNLLVRYGDRAANDRLVVLEKEQLLEPGLSAEARLKIRTRQVWQDIRMPRTAGGVNPYETGARALLQEFPDKPDAGYNILLQSVSYSGGENARPIIAEIVASNASDDLKSRARALLRRVDAVGKPVEIQFTALDGREVNLQAMKGKVVLIDFWATWCGPCVAETPNMKAAYEKLHEKGFEIIGLSFDSDKAKLEQYVKDKALPWPQFFDGKGWQNKYGQQWAISGIPTMWLVDKTGILREPNARGNLEEKVAKLLAE